jgi:hypothetical protein
MLETTAATSSLQLVRKAAARSLLLLLLPASLGRGKPTAAADKQGVANLTLWPLHQRWQQRLQHQLLLQSLN